MFNLTNFTMRSHAIIRCNNALWVAQCPMHVHVWLSFASTVIKVTCSKGILEVFYTWNMMNRYDYSTLNYSKHQFVIWKYYLCAKIHVFIWIRCFAYIFFLSFFIWKLTIFFVWKFDYIFLRSYWDRNPFAIRIYCHCLFFEKCNGSATVKILINRLCETTRFSFTFKIRKKNETEAQNNCVREKFSH